MKVAESDIKPPLRTRERLVLGVEAPEARRVAAAPSINWTLGVQRVETVMRRILTSYHSLALVSCASQLSIMLRIREVLGPNLGPDTDYPEWVFSRSSWLID
jgi:hypothetical protein